MNGVTLALDTSWDSVSVALGDGEKTWSLEADSGERHSDTLLEMVDTVVKMARLKAGDIALTACMKGPGSFTGLRVAYAAAKGLSLSLGVPFVTVPTLDCMAHPFAFWPGFVVPVIDAKKESLFAAVYRRGKPLTPYLDSTPEHVIEIINETIQTKTTKQDTCSLLFTGPSASLLYGNLPEDLLSISYVDNDIHQGKALEILDIIRKMSILEYESILSGPEYLRKSDAEIARDAHGS